MLSSTKLSVITCKYNNEANFTWKQLNLVAPDQKEHLFVIQMIKILQKSMQHSWNFTDQHGVKARLFYSLVVSSFFTGV